MLVVCHNNVIPEVIGLQIKSFILAHSLGGSSTWWPYYFGPVVRQQRVVGMHERAKLLTWKPGAEE